MIIIIVSFQVAIYMICLPLGIRELWYVSVIQITYYYFALHVLVLCYNSIIQSKIDILQIYLDC